MFVEFHLRSPGDHRKIFEVMMSTVPRVGESVSITEDGEVREVHSVTYIVTAAHQFARVLLHA